MSASVVAFERSTATYILDPIVVKLTDYVDHVEHMVYQVS